MSKAKEYYTAMQEQYGALSGSIPDVASDFSLRFWTLAEELAKLEEALEKAKRQCFGQTAFGEALDAHAQARGIFRREAAYALGTLTFYRQQSGEALTIPEGTVCAGADGVQCVTTQAAAFAEDALSASASARAARPGKAGNAAAGTFTRLQKPLEGVEQVENSAAFTGGADQETDASLAQRLMESYADPSNGANPAFYRQSAENWPGISSAAVTAQEGAVTVWVAADGENGVPEGTRQALAAHLEAQRELCMAVEVENAPVTEVDLQLEILPAAGWTMQQASDLLIPLLTGVLGRCPVGKTVTLAHLIQLVMASGAAANCRVQSPETDPTVGSTQVLRPGTVELLEMGAAG